MPNFQKAQVMILDGALAVLLAIMLSYVLFAAWPQSRHPTGDLALERAGYDIVNAFYDDEMIYGTMQRGLEVKGYLSLSEMSYLRQRLYNYGRIAGVGRIDVEVESSSQFSVETGNYVLTRREQFLLVMPLKGGSENRLVRVSLWR
ncbi:hypothetical protein H0N98_03200 [Candidatus Micrarchaeota archaeon]|nr:hypothetical protein [Candidatus Micrarchaeota archaeon]